MQNQLDISLGKMPIMAQRDSYIEAKTYNIWRRARHIWGAPMKMILPEINEFQLHLTDEYWVVVDLSKHEVPVLAWVEMADENRTDMYEPIICKLNYYHFAASAIRAKTLDLVEVMLSDRLYDYYH